LVPETALSKQLLMICRKTGKNVQLAAQVIGVDQAALITWLIIHGD
jgi:hypothetical protein